MSRKIALGAGAAGIACLGVALRLLAIPPALPDLDSVNFASSLSRFELASQAPHFPGYPLYVLAARFAFALGAGEIAALALPGIVLGAIAVVALSWAVATRAGALAGLGAGALFALAPTAVLTGGSPTSDGAGVAALAIVLALHAAAIRPTEAAGALSAGTSLRSAALGLSAAVVLGMRPSLAPAVALLWIALPSGRRLSWFAGASAGCVAWLLPMIFATGPRAFAAISTGFLRGHGGSWGGTLVSRPDLGERLAAFGFDLLAANLALPWPGSLAPARFLAAACLIAVFGGAIVLAARSGWGAGQRRLLLVAFLCAAPYAAWAFVGQNLEKPRHLLPLVPALAVALGAAISRLREWRGASAAIAAGTAAGLLAVSAPAALHQGRDASAGAALALGLRDRLSPAGVMIFTGQEGKLVERYAPEYRAGRVADPARLPEEARRLASAGVAVYVTSAAPGASRLSGDLEVVERFGACPVGAAAGSGCELLLYRFHPDKGSI